MGLSQGFPLVFLLGICLCVCGWALYDLDMKGIDYCRNCPNKYAKYQYIRIGKFNQTKNVFRAKFTLLLDLPSESKFELIAYEMKANNDYSKIPVRVYSGNYCTFMQSDQFYYKDLANHSNMPRSCPWKKGEYLIENYRINDRFLHPELPGDDWRYDFSITYKTEDILKFSLFVQINRRVDWRRSMPKSKID